jgi:hypothetical protein
MCGDSGKILGCCDDRHLLRSVPIKNQLLSISGYVPHLHHHHPVSFNHLTINHPLHGVDGRGKSSQKHAFLPISSNQFLKQPWRRWCVNTSKNLIGSAMVEVLEGFNAHAVSML